ncbi:hypothetical protein [Pseudomonas sp. yb_9]|uniref:hypothetical protein n=1 Tax=Pseudomonas sp. yb_9 TaxID=3367222 RepID=UPI00370A63AA
MLWYADKVGQLVEYIRPCPEGYMSREPSGHANIVRVGDAEVVEVTVIEQAIPPGPLRIMLEVELPEQSTPMLVNRLRQQLYRAVEGYDFSHTAKCTFVPLP